MTSQTDFRTGYVGIIGRPNVGKSTLLNRLIGQKLSITSRKPQTTRQRITGILNVDNGQLLFVDTPGFQIRHGSALNRSMNREATQAVADVDVVLFVVEALRFSAEDNAALKLIARHGCVILVINKIDSIPERALLLLFIETVKATRTEHREILNHGLSLLTFIGALVEFIVLKGFGTSTFFFITARRDMSVIPHEDR